MFSHIPSQFDGLVRDRVLLQLSHLRGRKDFLEHLSRRLLQYLQHVVEFVDSLREFRQGGHSVTSARRVNCRCLSLDSTFLSESVVFKHVLSVFRLFYRKPTKINPLKRNRLRRFCVVRAVEVILRRVVYSISHPI